MTSANFLRRWTLAPCSFLAVAVVSPAHALDPTQLFDKVSPSVWVVRTYDDAERPIGLGSAVVIDSGRLVTNCHVLAKAKAVFVRRVNVMYEAKLEHADAPRDLCILQVANFSAPAVQVRSVKDLKVGERVYAIGNPKGLEVTLSEGLISGLRSELLNESIDKEGNSLVQTTAALSPGSSGGGLFDAEGRLVGVTTFGWRDAQNLNVALPTDWIAQVPERAQAALARRNAPKAVAAAGAAAVPPGYPAPGTVWVYAFTEQLYARRKLDVTVRVLNVLDSVIEEAVTTNAPGAKLARRVVDVRDPRILEHALSANSTLIEIVPYLLAGHEGKTPIEISGVSGYPNESAGSGLSNWEPTAQVHDWEQVTVPAGSFRAVRVEVRGKRDRALYGPVVANRFSLSVWLAPDVKRIVKLEHKVWGNNGAPMANDVLELLSYRPPS